LLAATVVTAGIDPLRSDGEKLAEQLRDAGVEVEHQNYQGATHEFFGMATVVQAARDAQAFVVEAQKRYLG
jgi:acetyl esterase/lipase